MKRQHKFPTFIIDNFFESPSIVRNFALSQHFSKDQKGNFPGYRTNPINELDIEFYKLFANKLFTYFTLPGQDFDYVLECHFQYIDSSFVKGWVHCDTYTRYDFAGVVYLHPDPPDNTGTTIYEITDKTDQYENWETIARSKMDYMSDTCTQEQREKMAPLRDEYNSIFKIKDTCSNVYNRCLIFSPSQQHSEQNFFGTDKYDSRLTLPFFGKIGLHIEDKKYSFQRSHLTYY